MRIPDVHVCHIDVAGFQHIERPLKILRDAIAGFRQAKLPERRLVDPEPGKPARDKNDDAAA